MSRELGTDDDGAERHAVACAGLIRRTNRSTFLDGDVLDEAIQNRGAASHVKR